MNSLRRTRPSSTTWNITSSSEEHLSLNLTYVPSLLLQNSDIFRMTVTCSDNTVFFILQSVHTATLRGSKMQLGAVEAFRADMLKRLEKKPWIADHREFSHLYGS